MRSLCITEYTLVAGGYTGETTGKGVLCGAALYEAYRSKSLAGLLIAGATCYDAAASVFESAKQNMSASEFNGWLDKQFEQGYVNDPRGACIPLPDISGYGFQSSSGSGDGDGSGGGGSEGFYASAGEFGGSSGSSIGELSLIMQRQY